MPETTNENQVDVVFNKFNTICQFHIAMDSLAH